MTDRVPGAPGQYRATVSSEEFSKLQNGEAFTITMVRDDAPLTEGTPYSKAAVLPDSVANKICPDIQDPSPADAFAGLLPIRGGTMTGALTLEKQLELGSGGTGRDLSTIEPYSIIRAASNSAYLLSTPTANGAFFATGDNKAAKFATLPIAQGGTGATTAANAVTALGIKDYVVAQGTSGGWYYQKWNSKYVTAWRNITTTPTAQGTNYVTQALPFTLADKNYYVGVTGVSAAMSGFATDFNVSNSTPSEGRTTTNVTINYNYSRSSFYSVGMTVFIMGTLP